jgi:hypothetical protein
MLDVRGEEEVDGWAIDAGSAPLLNIPFGLAISTL